MRVHDVRSQGEILFHGAAAGVNDDSYSWSASVGSVQIIIRCKMADAIKLPNAPCEIVVEAAAIDSDRQKSRLMFFATQLDHAVEDFCSLIASPDAHAALPGQRSDLDAFCKKAWRVENFLMNGAADSLAIAH